MRMEFRFNEETQNKDDYFTKAATWVDSIKNETIIDGGRCLKNDLDEYEKMELLNYIMEQLMPEIEKEVRFRSNRISFDFYKKEELKSILTMKVFEDFHKFNNKHYLSDKQKRYTIATFIEHKAREAMRELIIQERGLPVNAIRNLRLIINEVIAIADEQKISQDEVLPEIVYSRLKDKSISYKMVLSLMDIYHGVSSIDDMLDSDERLADNNAEPELKIDMEMDMQTKKILDHVFYDFSKLEFYILIKEFGLLGEKTRKMTSKEITCTNYFVELAKEDKDGEKNIEFGNVCIKRPGRNSGRDKEIKVEDVYYVKEKFYSNKVAKVKKRLAGLNGKVEMMNVQGVLCKYCIEVWDKIDNKLEICN